MKPETEKVNDEAKNLVELYKSFATREQARNALLYSDRRFYVTLLAALIGGVLALLRDDLQKGLCSWNWFTQAILLIAGVVTVLLARIGYGQTLKSYLAWFESIAGMQELEEKLGMWGKSGESDQTVAPLSRAWKYCEPLVPERYRQHLLADGERKLSKYKENVYPRNNLWVYCGIGVIGVVFSIASILSIFASNWAPAARCFCHGS